MRSSRLNQRTILISMIALLALTVPVTLSAHSSRAAPPATDHFERTWERTDRPVAEGDVPRTWMWGPEANTDAMMEGYAEAPGGQRLVQYYDKSRMEDHSWRTTAPPWDVTNGLLAMEMITGRLQVGDAQFEQRDPSTVPIAGDIDPLAIVPRYGNLGSEIDGRSFLNTPPHNEGEVIIAEFSWVGGGPRWPRIWGWIENEQYATYGVIATEFVPETNHRIADPFWQFMNATGPVYESGQIIEDSLFENPFFATGYPVTEAYWWTFSVGGVGKEVLVQCFERRCLTYTPSNPPGWQVEAGNIGQHYYIWRYAQSTE